jgi:hypothetical protein
VVGRPIGRELGENAVGFVEGNEHQGKLNELNGLDKLNRAAGRWLIAKLTELSVSYG